MELRYLVLAVIALFAPLRLLMAQELAGTCTVESVTDGDTIRCGGERIRLLLIDAPEKDQGPFGRAAQAFLEAVLPPGMGAGLVLDVEKRDRYGRLLAYVYRPDGRMVNAMMARQGFAVPYVVPPNVRHIEEIRAAADSARAGGIGLWAIEAFECLPADHRAGRCGAAAPEPAVESAPTRSAGREECHPSYPDVCIPPPPPDLDCGDIPHRRFRVVGADPHRFDRDGDGVACESR